MKEVSDKLKDIMSTNGASEIRQSTLKHLSDNIGKEFHDSLLIISDDQGKLLIIPRQHHN